MHIIIYGVGAVGGFYGAELAKHCKSPNQISFIARGNTYTALSQNGIKLTKVLESGEQEIIHLPKINVYESLADLPADNDERAILLCVKSKDTIAAAQAIKPYLNSKTFVVSVQNGVDNEEKLRSVLGLEPVLGCYTNIAAENIEPGSSLLRGPKFIIAFGELAENLSNTRSERLLQVFLDSGLTAKLTKTIRTDLWSKLVWNTGFNSLCTLYEVPVGIIFREHAETLRALMLETKVIAQAQGIAVPDDIDEQHFRQTNKPIWDQFRPSTLQDWTAGKPIEIDELLGVVVHKGRDLSISVPVSEQIYSRLLDKISQTAKLSI